VPDSQKPKKSFAFSRNVRLTQEKFRDMLAALCEASGPRILEAAAAYLRKFIRFTSPEIQIAASGEEITVGI